jgi:hypothetical protein
MAKQNASATENKQAAPSATPDASQDALKVAAEAKAAERKELIDSLTFEEAFQAIARKARWGDVMFAAETFGKTVAESAKSSDGKPTAIARKAASINASGALMLRLALASYSLSGRGANPTQTAELASKLPALVDKGALRDRKVTFGGIVLPPIAGEL